MRAKDSNEYPYFPDNCRSLLKKHLTPEIFGKLINVRSKSGYSLNQLINSGLENPDSSVGVYLGDQDSYAAFALLLDKIIDDYHGHKNDTRHIGNLNSANLKTTDLDPERKYILSTRIRVARNLADIPLGPGIRSDQRNQLEKDVASVLTQLPGELSGTYYPLGKIDKSTRQQLVADHFLFKQGDRFLQAGGLNRDWPHGRGIYHNSAKTFLVWVNEEDHLRIISMQPGGDIKATFSRLTKALDILGNDLEFAYSDHLGYIGSCPTNLGTAMRASVHVKLPRLGKNQEEFEAIANKYQVQIRGIDGEHSDSRSGVYDISNRRRLGISEVECIQSMHDGVLACIEEEKSLASLI
jgi:arginine kinase